MNPPVHSTKPPDSVEVYISGDLPAPAFAPWIKRDLKAKAGDPGRVLGGLTFAFQMAMVQNQWYHFGIGAPPMLEPIVVGLGCSLGARFGF